MRPSAPFIQLFAAALACNADADVPSLPAPAALANPPPAAPPPAAPSLPPTVRHTSAEAVRRTSFVERVALGDERKGWRELWLAVTFVNDTPETAWFALHLPIKGSGDVKMARRGIKVHVEKISAGDGGEARWLRICDEVVGCDHVARLAPGQRLEIEPFQAAVEAEEASLVVEIWRLSVLRFDRQPAELWLADELAPAARELRGRPLFAPREHPPLARRGGARSPRRVDLEPAERLTFDISTVPSPPRHAP